MKLKLHHINLSTNNVSGMDHFYQNVLGLKAETDGLPVLEKNKGYDGDVAFVAGGAFMPGYKRFVETLKSNLKNDPEFELVRLSDGNAVRRRSLV